MGSENCESFLAFLSATEELTASLLGTRIQRYLLWMKCVVGSKIKISASPISGGAMSSGQPQSAMRKPNSTPECIYETLREIQVSKKSIEDHSYVKLIHRILFVGKSHILQLTQMVKRLWSAPNALTISIYPRLTCIHHSWTKSQKLEIWQWCFKNKSAAYSLAER